MTGVQTCALPDLREVIRKFAAGAKQLRAAAIDIFRENPTRFRVVLLDLTMPHLNGEGCFRQMRIVCPEVRVIIISGFSEIEAGSRFTGRGLAGFIQKPFEMSVLSAALAQALGRTDASGTR